MSFKKIISCFIFILSVYFLYPQDDLLGAKQLLQKFSDIMKSSIRDYQADIKWTIDNNIQKGTLFFKNPQKLRINFTEPGGQVICTNGYILWVYIDYMNLALKQEVLQKDKVKGEDGSVQSLVNPVLLSPVGFDRFLSDYSIEYQDTTSKVDYKDGTKVYKLKLIRWKSLRSGFNTVYLTIQENGLVRRVEAVTASYRKVILELDNIQLNKNLGDSTFNYEPPAQANTIENFISNQGEN
jgi:outer membrane lipoprotein-sorting protein